MTSCECRLSVKTRPNPSLPPKRAWNSGIQVGKKKPLTRRQAKQIRHYLQNHETLRNQVLFSLGYDCALRSSDITGLRIGDVLHRDGTIKTSFTIIQMKTKQPVECVIGKATRKLLARWIKKHSNQFNSPLFPGRTKYETLGLRQHQRLIKRWVSAVGLNSQEYSSHTMRRTKASIVFSKSQNLEYVRMILGQRTIAAAASYLGVTKEKALAFSNKMALQVSPFECISDFLTKMLSPEKYTDQFQVLPQQFEHL